MASLEQKIEAEHGVRELLKQNGMPQPDGVEYGYGCIRLFFDEPKVVLIVDIDEPPPGYEAPADGLEVTYPDDEGDEPDPDELDGYLKYRATEDFGAELN